MIYPSPSHSSHSIHAFFESDVPHEKSIIEHKTIREGKTDNLFIRIFLYEIQRAVLLNVCEYQLEGVR